MKNPAVDNLASIVAAIEQHNARCPSPAVAVLLHPIELERLGWDDGDQVAGCELRAEPRVQTGTVRVVCAKDDVESGETVEAVADQRIEERTPAHA